PHDRAGHHVSARVPHHFQRSWIRLPQQAERNGSLGRKGIIEAYRLVVHDGGHGRLSQPRTDVGRDIGRSNGGVVLFYTTIGQMNFEHNAAGGSVNIRPLEQRLYKRRLPTSSSASSIRVETHPTREGLGGRIDRNISPSYSYVR